MNRNDLDELIKSIDDCCGTVPHVKDEPFDTPAIRDLQKQVIDLMIVLQKAKAFLETL